MTTLTPREVDDRLRADGLSGWGYFLRTIRTRITTGDFATGLRLTNQIGALAEEANHHPDLDLRYGRLDVTLTSHDAGGVTDRDLAMAARITELVTEAGLDADCTTIRALELGLDTPSADEIAPFWRTLLGSDSDAESEVTDPDGDLPAVWFQRSGRREPRQHWHPDIYLEASQVQTTIDAALEAGGSLVTDECAPSFWVLADAQGNKVCLCTWASD